MEFTWDEDKNIENQIKHGVSFEQALYVFNGSEIIEYDKDHSTLDEDRYIARNTIQSLGLVIVVFVEIKEDTIRIISARKGSL